MKNIMLTALMSVTITPIFVARHARIPLHGLSKGKTASVSGMAKSKAGPSAIEAKPFAGIDPSNLPNPTAFNALTPPSAGAGGPMENGINQNIDLTPNRMGLSVINNLADKGGQVFNVKAYGAKGDGTTNDTAAFQAAWNAAVAAGGGTVLVPQTASCYLLNSPINMTSTKGAFDGIIVAGVSYKHAAVKVGAPGTICGNTGGIVFDVTGSSGITFRDLDVTSQAGVTSPSLIGLYAARDSRGKGVQGINVYDCSFKMVSHTRGTTYSFGAYLYGSEGDYFYGDTFIADYPLVVTVNNDFKIHSAFITESSTGRSETGDNFRSMELDSQGLGPGAYFNGTWDMILQGHIFNFSGGAGYALYGYAIEMLNTNRNMDINVQQEGYPGFLYLDLSLENSTITGSDAPFRGEAVLHAVEFVDASSQILGDRFNINDDDYPTRTNNYYYDGSTGATPGVATVDGVYFYCGNQANCVNIPIGRYQPAGWSQYEHDITWSGSSTNWTPNIIFNHPIYGSFTVPIVTVAAGQCFALPAVAAQGDTGMIVTLSNTEWYNTIVTLVPGNGSFIPKLCNPTSSPITTGAPGTVHWKILQ